MIAVVDYCKGNLMSVERGLRCVGGDAQVTADPDVIVRADAVVLPGVGAFADASRSMVESGQMEAVRLSIAQGKPFLGICLGAQLLFDGGTEHADLASPAAGLGVLEGVCSKLPAHDAQGALHKIPHVGWNSVEQMAQAPLFAGIPQGEHFYFTHSYRMPDTSAAIACTTHSETFPAAVQAGPAAFGVQFHPEKSSDAGLQLLKNFLSLL